VPFVPFVSFVARARWLEYDTPRNNYTKPKKAQEPKIFNFVILWLFILVEGNPELRLIFPVELYAATYLAY
jgi:hypothetical protein